MKKRVLAMLLTLLMVIGMLPMAVFADGEVSLLKLDTGHRINVTFTVLYVGEEFKIGYNYGTSEKTTFVCQYTQSHSDTAYNNHTIAISDIKAAAGRATVNTGYEIVGWSKEANANPKILGFNLKDPTACNKGTTIYLVAKNPNPNPEHTFTLKYNANDGTGNIWRTDSNNKTGDSCDFTVVSGKPTREGYDLKGWADSADATSARYQAGDPVTVTKNDGYSKTIYAVWADHVHKDGDSDGFCDDDNACMHPKDKDGYCTVGDCNHPHVGDGACCPKRPQHDHDYKGWKDNGDGTHTGTCECDKTKTEGHVDDDNNGFCDKCGACTHPHENGYCTKEDCDHTGKDCCKKPEPKPDTKTVNVYVKAVDSDCKYLDTDLVKSTDFGSKTATFDGEKRFHVGYLTTTETLVDTKGDGIEKDDPVKTFVYQQMAKGADTWYPENGVAKEFTWARQILFTELSEQEDGTYNLYGQIILYKLTLDTDGGSLTDENPEGYFLSGSKVTLPIPVKGGYSFVNWEEVPFDGGDGDGGVIVMSLNTEEREEQKITISYDVTYKAIWEKLPGITLTYDANAPAGKTVVNVPDAETQPVDAEGKATFTISGKTPKCDGYTFIGWSRTTYLANRLMEGGEELTTSESLTLYAMWVEKEDEYKVIYKYDDSLPQAVQDTLPKDDETYSNGQEVTVKAPKDTEVRANGYIWTFKIWKLDNAEVAPSTHIKMKDSDLVFHGIWESTPIAPTEKYTLTINYVDQYNRKLHDSYTGQYVENELYSVRSPEIYGYRTYDTVVKGKMLARNVTINVVYYVEQIFPGGMWPTYPPHVKKDEKPQVTEEVTENPLKFDTIHHFAYVNGYPDGLVRPENNITRAEVAAILYRLMEESSVEKFYKASCGFYDVAADAWYSTYVSTLDNAGVITDSASGYFRPDEAITRAELAAMLAPFATVTGAKNTFSDVSDTHWAADAIAVCAKMGWIKGYPDGTFRPDQTITRAEMMAMVNRALDRTPQTVEDLLPDMKTWADNADTDMWYYLDVQEATNSHTYVKSDAHETWEKLIPDMGF